MQLTYHNILVAVDGSKESERALKKALLIAQKYEAKMILAHVIDTRTFSAAEVYDTSYAERAISYAKEMMENYLKMAHDFGLKEVEYTIEYGSPKVKIPKDLAEKYNVDLIICGATGMNAVERFLLGSVSENIARHAKCDVLIVRSEPEE